MTSFANDRDRAVIPRWRTFQKTLELGELASPGELKNSPQGADQSLGRLLQDWKEHKQLAFAADAVGSAIVLGAPEMARDAARFIIQHKDDASSLLISLAGQILTPGKTSANDNAHSETNRFLVNRLRTSLREYPKNPILWVDLSRLYAVDGRLEKADRAMTAAFALARTNRFVCRSASRLAIHREDYDKAQWVLKRALEAGADPWVLAADLAAATARGKTSKKVKDGIRVLENERRDKHDLSELASAVATIELNAGKTRAAKKWFKLSLQQPTENAIAQAAWAHRKEEGIVSDANELTGSPEAMAWMLYQSGEWTKAIKYTKEWLADQPFSSRPAIHASYIAMVALQDYEESAAIALQGLRANPQEFLLINNRAAALALMDKPDAARKLFATARTDKLDKTGMVVWHATSGLIAFRSSHVDAGRRLYEQAIKQAEAMKSDRLVVMATLFYSMEESKHDIGRAKALIASTLKRRRLVSERGVDVLADRAMSAVTQLT